jgi:DNA-binding CsgD family transcriptional regulator
MNAVNDFVRSIDARSEPAPVSDGVVIVDASLRPVALDRGAEAIFRSFTGHTNGNGGESIPAPILNILRSRSTHEGETNSTCASADGHHFSCRVFSVRPMNGLPILIVYLRREVSLAEAVHQIAVDHRLTDREEEALIGLAMGLSSKELAVRMKISPNTVKAFVRLAMIKLGASSRSRLFAKLLDRQTG